jgi:TfoX/Sxy family transcriptional regulator of competence genes
MASDPEFVAFVCEQLRGAGEISSKRMFGEAAVYLSEKVVGLVCDNQFFVKPTAPGRALLGSPTEAPPFSGATNWFLMTDIDDPEFLAELIRVTAHALPVPKPKKKTTGRKAKTPARKKVVKQVVQKAVKKTRKRI